MEAANVPEDRETSPEEHIGEVWGRDGIPEAWEHIVETNTSRSRMVLQEKLTPEAHGKEGGMAGNAEDTLGLSCGRGDGHST